MNEIGKGLLRLLVWGGGYALMLLQHTLVHRLAHAPSPVIGTWPRWPGLTRAMGILIALVAGAMIPLMPPNLPNGVPPVHMWGSLDGSLVLVTLLNWAAAAWLAFSAAPSRWGQDDEERTLMATRLGIQAVLTLLLISALLVIRSAFEPVDTRLTAWSSVRGIWPVVVQPIAFLLWLVGTSPPAYDVVGRALPGKEMLALNHALLTATLFLGGTDGPFVQSSPWLGGLYLALKADLVTILSARLVTIPTMAWQGNLSRLWRVAVPIAALNLALTALAVAWIQTGR